MNNPPICVFVYNRPEETKRLLSSLLSCLGIENYEVFFFSDGPKLCQHKSSVLQVRSIIADVTGFKTKTIIENDTNKGLRKSIIDGVSRVLSSYSSVIVLEDDLIVSSDFLRFMSDGLRIFATKDNIWSISGYTPPIEIPKDYHHDIFLVQRGQCWGWATWADRWNSVDWNISQFKRLKNKKIREQFNKGGNDMYRLLELQKKDKINSWAICWCFSQFLQHKWTVNPCRSKVTNVGFSEAASHNGLRDSRHAVTVSDESKNIEFDILPNKTIMNLFKQHHDLDVISKVGYFMRLHGLGYKTIKRILKRL